MLLDSVTNSGSLPALEKLVAFAEARHQVLLNNVANLDTPGYRVKDLDVEGFEAHLSRAIQRREHSGDALDLEPGENWSFDRAGRLHAEPMEVGPENVLFHDGTNASVERQMNELAKNAIMHQTAVELMRQRYGQLMAAIRGQVG